MVTGVTSGSGGGAALTALALNDQSTAFYCEKKTEKCSCDNFLSSGQYCEAGEDEMCQGCVLDGTITDCQTPGGDPGKMCKCFYTCQ
jgi:hypothetical protein